MLQPEDKPRGEGFQVTVPSPLKLSSNRMVAGSRYEYGVASEPEPLVLVAVTVALTPMPLAGIVPVISVGLMKVRFEIRVPPMVITVSGEKETPNTLMTLPPVDGP